MAVSVDAKIENGSTELLLRVNGYENKFSKNADDAKWLLCEYIFTSQGIRTSLNFSAFLSDFEELRNGLQMSSVRAANFVECAPIEEEIRLCFCAQKTGKWDVKISIKIENEIDGRLEAGFSVEFFEMEKFLAEIAKICDEFSF